MTTATENAVKVAEQRRTDLAAARQHADTTRKKLEAAKQVRANLTAASSEADIKKARQDFEIAEERHALAMKAMTDAEKAVRAAEERVKQAEISDRHDEQHRRGVVPIVDLEKQIQHHLAVVAQLRKDQEQVFKTEVAPRNDPWQRTLSPQFEQPPPHHYESVLDCVVRGQGFTWQQTMGPLADDEQARNRANAAAARRTAQPEPWAEQLTQEQCYQLAFCIDCRGVGVASDLQLSCGLSLAQLRELAGGPRVLPSTVGYVEVDERIKGEIVRGLPRAMRIAEKQTGRVFDARTYEIRRKGWQTPQPAKGARP